MVDVFAFVALKVGTAVDALLTEVVEGVHAPTFEPVLVAGVPVGQVEVALYGVVKFAALAVEGVGIANGLVAVVEPDDGYVANQAGGDGLATPLGGWSADDALNAAKG